MSYRSQVAAQIAADLELWKRRALSHGGVIPAMWLDRGYIVRCHSWLGDRWGGDAWWIVENVVFDPPVSHIDPKLGRSYGYVRIYMQREASGVSMSWEAHRSQDDLIELLSPRICTPMQWRARCG